MYKRLLRTVCAFALICILLLQACPVSALDSVRVYMTPMQYASLSDYTFKPQTVDFSKSHLFKDQLTTDEQRALYEKLTVATPADGALTLTVDDLPEFPAITDGAFEPALIAYLTDTVLPAYAAAVMDTPMLFWTTSVGYSCSYSVRGDQLLSVDVICLPTVAAGFSQNNYNYARKQIDAVLDSLTFDGATQRELLLQFHDYLCEKIEYIETTYAHNIYGALVEGKAVCEGYAESFKLFCDMYGIPCMLISGMAATGTGYGPHEWNAVRMEDGKWYGVDVTWDDQNKIYCDFFLVGSESIPEHFSKYTFDESHIPGGDFFGNGAVTMQFPTLSETVYSHSYDKGVITTAPTCKDEGVRTYTCLICQSQYTEPVPTVDHSYMDGACVFCGIPAPESAAGDCNGDGKINGKDSTILLRYIANLDITTGASTVTVTSGADCNGDGKINGRDVTRLLQYLANYNPATGESSVTLGK